MFLNSVNTRLCPESHLLDCSLYNLCSVPLWLFFLTNSEPPSTQRTQSLHRESGIPTFRVKHKHNNPEPLATPGRCLFSLQGVPQLLPADSLVRSPLF